MRIAIKEMTFTHNAELADAIVEWVEAQDMPVSVRRVFYAMVTREVIENTMAQYKRVSRVTLDLRRSGRLDWSLIVDDTRGTYKTHSYGNVDNCVKYALNNFRLNRWEGQLEHVQVWVEKRGHVSILYPITDSLDVVLVENGGRKAITEEAVEPFHTAQESGRRNRIIYVGDYDPSGLQMDENMRNQLAQWGVEVEWERVALTFDHIQSLPRAYVVPDTASKEWLSKHPDVEILGYNKQGIPLVNKLEKDVNAQWFKNQHGGDLFQIEVDAMEPAQMRDIVREAISEVLDWDMYNTIRSEENDQRDRVRAALGYE